MPDRLAPGPPDPVLEAWKQRIVAWRAALSDPVSDHGELAAEMFEAGLRAMPVRHQMELQWTFIAAGLAEVMRSRRTERES